MAVTPSERLALYESIRTTVGDTNADTLMNLLPDIDWNDLATDDALRHQGLALRSEMHQLGTELRAEMGELRTDLHAEMGELRTELRAEMGELRTDLHAEMNLRFATTERRIMVMVLGSALTMWIGFATTIATIVTTG